MQSRIAQLVARYVAMGLVALAAHIGTQISDGTAKSVGEAVGALAAAAVLAAWDHWSHGKQKQAVVANVASVLRVPETAVPEILASQKVEPPQKR